MPASISVMDFEKTAKGKLTEGIYILPYKIIETSLLVQCTKMFSHSFLTKYTHQYFQRTNFLHENFEILGHSV